MERNEIAPIRKNDERTGDRVGTQLTQPSPASFTVPPNLKHHMRILRKKFGADSKIGRRASNVEEAILNLPDPAATGEVIEFQRTYLEKSIKRQIEGIARLMTE